MFTLLGSVFHKALTIVAITFIAIGNALGGPATSLQTPASTTEVTVDLQATSTSSSISTSTSDFTPVDLVKTAPTEKNYRTDVLAVFEERIKTDDQAIVYATDVVNYVNLVLQQMTQTRDETRAIVGSNPDNISTLLLNYYGSAITYDQSILNLVSYQKSRLEGDEAYTKSNIGQLPEIISKTDALAYMKSAGDLTGVLAVRDSLSQTFDGFSADVKQKDSELEQAFELASQKSNIPYIPPPTYVAPQIQIPRIYQTSCTLSYDTITCQTYPY
jgi:hypothetical protein